MLERALFLAALAAAVTVGFTYLGGRLAWTPVARASVLANQGIIVFCAVLGSTAVRGSTTSPAVGGLLGSVAGLAAALLVDRLRRRL